MKTIAKLMFSLLLSAFAFTALTAQEVAMLTPGTNSGEVAKAPAPAATNTELNVTLKNTAATNIYVFAGPKEGIRDPRIETYGGYSKNILYVQVNDVVCLMNADKKPTACTVVKPGISDIEVNPSGNGIISK